MIDTSFLNIFSRPPVSHRPSVMAFINGVRDMRLVEPIAAEFERIEARTDFLICRLDGRGQVQPPRPLPGTAGRFFTQHNAAAVLIAGDRCQMPRHLIAALAKRATPIVWLAPDQGAAPPTDVVIDAVYYPRRHSVQEVVRSLLVMADRQVLARPRGEPQLLKHIATTAAARMDGERRPVWVRRLASRIANVDDLRQLLGRPKTILCLGNGPSAEDRAVLSETHDALFRIDDTWLARGLLCQPHIVFTKRPETMRLLEGPIFGLHGEEAESDLLACRLKRPWRRPPEYFLADKIADPYAEFRWGDFRATSESAMVASAVALVPKKLIIAGIDMPVSLLNDSSGSDLTFAGYTSRYDRDKQMGYMLGCLDRHIGELEVFGEGLSEVVKHRRRRGL